MIVGAPRTVDECIGERAVTASDPFEPVAGKVRIARANPATKGGLGADPAEVTARQPHLGGPGWPQLCKRPTDPPTASSATCRYVVSLPPYTERMGASLPA